MNVKGGGSDVFLYPSYFPFLANGSYFISGGYLMNNTEKRFYTPQFSETASVSGAAEAATPFRMVFKQTNDTSSRKNNFTLTVHHGQFKSLSSLQRQS